MSSTSNAQDLLVNVFRPTYRWDSNTGFVPSLTVSNVSEVIAGRIQTDTLVVSDAGNNTYIGSSAGEFASNTACNVGLGYSAMASTRNSSNNVAAGNFALYAASNATSNVVLGANSGLTGSNGGARNVLLGPNVTVGTGNGNILIGADISVGTSSNRFQLGKLLYGNLSTGYIGVNLADPSGAFDVSGTTFFRGKVGIQTPPVNPKYSLDVNGSIFANGRFFGGRGSLLAPLYSFDDASGSGMYVPQANDGYGNGAFAIGVNQKPAAVFSDLSVNFFRDLDVSGTFSARTVILDAFAVQAGTRSAPTITFASNRSDGFYHLAGTDGFSVVTVGQDRMMFLGSGDISSARILGSDISLTGTILSSAGCNVIGGVTLCNGNVILTGTATNSNLLVPGWIRDNETAPTIDISENTMRATKFRALNGSALAPAYSFVNDSSSGMHLTTRGTIAFDTSGFQRMCISGGFVGIGTAVPRVALEVVGDVSATTYNGPGGTAGAPHYTFSDDRTTGVFFPGANIIGLTAGGTERMRISNGSIGIGTTTPANALDVNGTLRVIGSGDITLANGAISIAGSQVISSSGVLSNGAATVNSIGGVTLCNGDTVCSGKFVGLYANRLNEIGGVTLCNSDIVFSGRISNTTIGNINVIGGVTLNNSNITSGITQSSNFRGSNGSALIPTYSFASDPSTGIHWAGNSHIAFDTSGVQRMCISGGNVGIGTTLPNYLLDVNGTIAANSNEYTVYVTSSGDVPVPSGFTKAVYTIVGGGAGGGGSATGYAGAGGGGSGFIITQLATSISTFTVTIGNGGAGGGPGLFYGSNGGATSISYGTKTAVANGGIGGYAGGVEVGGQGGRGGAYGGGGGGGRPSYAQGIGGYGRLFPGENGIDFDWFNYTSLKVAGGAGGAASNGGTGASDGNGGGGGGPEGGKGAGLSAATAGILGCGGGGANSINATGGAGGNGYAIIKFLR